MGAKISYGKKNDLALKTWVKLARTFSIISHRSDENIRSYNLTTPQFGVIEALGHLGPLRVGQLCKKMLVSGGNMTLVLDNLEKQELIERIFSKEDRRAILIQLTNKGSDLFDNVFHKHADTIGELMSILSSEEQNQLSSLLKKLGTTLAAKD